MQWLIGFTKKNWFHTKVFLIFFPNFMEKYELYFGYFFSHLKKLHSILRYRLEKLNCGFYQSFHSLKNTTKLVTISGKTLQFFPKFSHFLHNFSPHCAVSTPLCWLQILIGILHPIHSGMSGMVP